MHTEEKVVRLRTPPPPPPPSSPPSRPTGLHGLAISGMAFFALVGIASMFAFFTLNWPDEWRGHVTAVFGGSIIGFLTCASTAVFSAARAAYPRRSRDAAADEDTAGE